MKYIYIIILLIGNICFGQNLPGGEDSNVIDYNNITLPTGPTASTLGAYGSIPVDLSKGIPKIQIPIYTLDIDGVSVPIYLSYNASGVRVDEFASVVGLGWSLHAGGAIYRTVNGNFDESGWLDPDLGPIPQSWYDDHPYGLENNQNALLLKAKLNDHMPDLYSYDFLNYSNKFIWGPLESPLSQLKAFKDIILEPSMNKNNLDIYFDVFDNLGNYYSFGKDGATEKSKNFMYFTRGDLEEGHTEEEYLTAFMLNRIETKNENTISFEYDSYQPIYDGYILANSLGTYNSCYSDNSNTVQLSSSKTNIINPKNISQLLKKIYTDNIQIDFSYSMNHEASAWKMQLDLISISDLISGNVKKFHFEYGLFSGDPRLKLLSVNEEAENGFHKPSYEFTYEPGVLPNKFSVYKDFFGFYNGSSGNRRSLVPTSESIKAHFNANAIPYNTYKNYLGNRKLDENFIKNGILTQIKYPTGGRTRFSYSANKEGSKYVGGVRVETIEDIDANGVSITKKAYKYEMLEGSDMDENIQHTINVENNSTYYNSNFVLRDYILAPNGYLYKRVTINSLSGENINYKEVFEFDELNVFGELESLLKKRKYFNNENSLVKLEEYKYTPEIDLKTINWLILGARQCFQFGNTTKKTFGYINGQQVEKLGNYMIKPTKVYSTNFLQLEDYLEPVTTEKSYVYNDNLLVKEETLDTRYTANVDSNGDIVNYVLDSLRGDIIKIDYQYASEKKPMIAWTIPDGLPIGKLITNGTKKLVGHYFEYDDLGNIKSTYRYNKGGGTHSGGPEYVPSNYELDTSYLTYEGKPVQIKGHDGIITSFVWGYNNQYPVARIVGLPYSSIPAASITQIQNLSVAIPYNESALISELESLRTSFPNAQVTTYTYSPLFGVTTITDSKGVRIDYIYDGFGGLIYVKDQEGNILSKNEYSYKN